jgi:hypothetical protein
MLDHPQLTDDDEDRRNRFLASHISDSGMSQRAASQPPHSSASDQNYLSSPPQQHHVPSSLGGGSISPWHAQQQQRAAGLNVNLARAGLPSSVPTRSPFSATQAQFSDAMRGSRAFASTREADESLDSLSDTYDDHYFAPSIPMPRGRQYTQDLTRSRSQSLAATRPGTIGGFQGLSPGGWNEGSSSHPLNIPGRYGEIKPPGSSRYGSFGTLGISPSNNGFYPSSPSSGASGLSPIVGNGFSHRQSHHAADISNISPFVRDVGQILVDDGSAWRELWAGMHPPRDENGGGGSGTTSRRHSVSVVQPRRGNIVGFHAPGNDSSDEAPTSSSARSTVFPPASFGRGGLMLTDDDLASDLGMLNLGVQDGSSSGIPTSVVHPPSQPSSLPIYARNPDRVPPYPSINLTIPTGSFASRQTLSSPSDSGLSAGASPTRTHAPPFEHGDGGYLRGSAHTAALTARFIPGHGIQYVPAQSHQHQQHVGTYTRARAPSYSGPISPTSRGAPGLYQQQSQQHHQPAQRSPPDASAHPPALSELGKGVPLHAVPASWPLFIVEFKAGRTDLFYLTDLSLDIRVGDLVIVEADRGKDLGKVINDSITVGEVEAFQRDQMARVGWSGNGEPMSPGGTAGAGVAAGGTGSGGTKKEINPKMIYGKAQSHDTQYVLPPLHMSC